MWQSLATGPNYKAAYCMAVCPAGADVIAPFLASRPGFLKDVVRPLQEKVEPVYVVPDTDAEQYVRKRFPWAVRKRTKSPSGYATRLRLLSAVVSRWRCWYTWRSPGPQRAISSRCEDL